MLVEQVGLSYISSIHTTTSAWQSVLAVAYFTTILEYVHFALFSCLSVALSQIGKMRSTALVSAVLCFVALILSFLCLFAGSKEGFMEDYAMITVSLQLCHSSGAGRTDTCPAQHFSSRRECN